MLTSLVSVIIPCYNADKFLTETLDSVFSQTFTDYEVILVDDGSTDNTSKIIESLNNTHPEIKAIFQTNQGASAARNSGTRLADGKFIQYLDADDLLCKFALEKRVDALLRTGADVAYSDWQKLVEISSGEYRLDQIMSGPLEDANPNPEIALFTEFWAPPAALLYRRSIVDQIGLWNETLPIIQDARFLLDAALVGGTFVHVPEVLAQYRVHKTNSLSKRNKFAFAHDCYTNVYQVEAFWQTHGGITLERKEALLKGYGQVARFFFEHDRSRFYEILSRIHHLNPEYIPTSPMSLRILSQIMGYERAEAIALSYRRLKKALIDLLIG